LNGEIWRRTGQDNSTTHCPPPAARADFDVSTIVQPDKAVLPVVANPIIGQLKINVDTLLNSGRPTVVASIDDPMTLRKFDVEATVTRVN
jgi:hypothetical protein